MYRTLDIGEVLQTGDEGYTWADPDCTTKGWVSVGNAAGEKVDAHTVPIRRKVEDVGDPAPRFESAMLSQEA